MAWHKFTLLYIGERRKHIIIRAYHASKLNVGLRIRNLKVKSTKNAVEMRSMT